MVIIIRNFLPSFSINDIPKLFYRANFKKYQQHVDDLLNQMLNISKQDMGFFYLSHDGIQSDESRWWLLFEPVHIQVGWNKVSFIRGESIDVSTDETDTFLQQLSEGSSGGYKWIATNTNRWFCLVDELPDIYDNNVETSVSWKKQLTEWEMILHGSCINARLVASNRPTINGIRLISYGSTTKSWTLPINPFEHIWTNDKWLQDLCNRQNKCPHQLKNSYPSIESGMRGPFLIDDQFNYLPWNKELHKVVSYLGKININRIDLYLDSADKSSSIGLLLRNIDRYKFWKNNQNEISQYLKE